VSCSGVMFWREIVSRAVHSSIAVVPIGVTTASQQQSIMRSDQQFRDAWQSTQRASHLMEHHPTDSPIEGTSLTGFGGTSVGTFWGILSRGAT
jgi:hypothetical protein